RVTSEHAVLHLLCNTFLDGRNVFLGDHPTHHFVDEFETFRTLIVGRREADPAVAVLAATTGLAHELAFDLAGLGDALAVGHLGLADMCYNVDLAAHAVDDDVQVQFAQAEDAGLTGFLNGPDPEGRILRRELAKGHAHFFLIRLGAGLDGDGNHRL